jgi:hypothetical protein
MKTPLPIASYRLSQVCGFAVSWGARFYVDGNEYRFTATNLEHLELLAKIRAALPKSPSAFWLLPFRDLVRSTTAGAIFAYAAQHSGDRVVRLLAVWLRGRRGGKLGTPTIAALYWGGDAPLRKTVVRALQRMHAWSALRRIEASEEDPRIRRLARQKRPRAYGSRMTQFIEHVTPCKSFAGETSLYECEGLQLDAGLQPRHQSFFRTILERIRRLVRGDGIKLEIRSTKYETNSNS